MDLTIQTITPSLTLGAPWITGPTNLDINSGGIDIGGDVNAATDNEHTAVVTDNTTVKVTVTQSGYYSYSMDFNVWEDDLRIFIVLVPIITDINDPYYNMPFPCGLFIQRPCGGIVDIYDCSSAPGDNEFYLNGSLLHQGSRFVYQSCTTGQVQFITRKTTYDVTSGSCPTKELRWDLYNCFGDSIYGNATAGESENVQFYLDQCTHSGFTINPWAIEVSLETSPVEDECGCFNQGDEVTITPTVTLGNPVGGETLTWEILDPNGIPVLEEVGNLFDPVIVVIEELGIYQVNTKVNNDCETYDYGIQLKTCDFVVITQTGCSDFLIQNKGDVQISFEIQDIQGNEVMASMTLDPVSETVVTFDQVGFYNVIVTIDSETRNYLINNYCEIENCISSYIESLLCEPVDRCDPCPEESDLNQMLLFQYTYFNKLHKEFTFNNFYTGLDQSKIDQITTIEQLASKMLTFCQRMGCFSSDTFRPAGEETYDWAGKGDNVEKTCSCSPTKTLNYYQTGPNYTGCKSCGS